MDLIPMYRNTSEPEVRGWKQDDALRRYNLILAKLGVKK